MRAARALVFLAYALGAHPMSTAHAQTPSPPPDSLVGIELDTLYSTYASDAISLPLGVGLRVPSYDRVNGVSLPWGPRIRVPGGRIDIDPIVTYRSNLGQFDPSATATIRFGRNDKLDIRGGRETFTNDGWIRSDLTNTLTSLAVGSDARNYFRADRAMARLTHAIVVGHMTHSLFAGGQHEFDWSTGIHARHTRAPWSALGRTDSLRMRRVNPAILSGHITSILAGVGESYEQDELKASFDALVERAFDGPDPGSGDDDTFTQVTLHAKAEFPTFGVQSFAFRGHFVGTPGGGAPPQRFNHLGGAGTLATVDLLALGGDRLLYVEGEYDLPLPRPILPLIGSPVLSARYAAGSAGVGELPEFIQNLGVGIGAKLVKIEYHIDPSYRKTSFTHRHAFTVGFSLSL
jgi:hypothetical protein